MPIAPLQEAFVQIHEPLRHLRHQRIAPVHVDQNSLDLRRRLVDFAQIALEQRLRYRVVVLREVIEESVPQRRLARSAGRASALAEQRLDLAELLRLKAAPGLEPEI